MSKFYVYNSIPLVLPASSKYGKDKDIPRNSRLVFKGFDGVSCLVKPAGKGNYRTFEVSIHLLAIRHSLSNYGPVVSISVADFLRYGRRETPYERW